MSAPETSETVFNIRLFGAFGLFQADGTEVSLTSRKSIALLALLCRAEGFRHERSWIMSMLWGSRGIEQAQSSLRQELLRLRKLLNTDAEVLHVSRTQVWLDETLVSLLPAEPGRNFLEGLILRGEDEFADWLEQQRGGVRRVPTPLDWTTPVLATGMDRITVSIDIQQRGEALGLSDFALRMLQSTLARGLDDFGGMRVVDGQTAVSDIVLQMNVMVYGGRTAIVAILRRTSDMQILFSVERYLSSDNSRPQELTEEINIFASELVERTLTSVVKHATEFAQDGQVALRHAQAAINAFFSRRDGAAELAENHLQQAIDLADDSAFWAWRAYNMLLFIEQGRDGDHNTYKQYLETAREYSERAVELDPFNGLTRALVAHVNAFVFRDFERAGSSLEQALELRPDHIMTQDAAALFGVYTDKLDSARAAAFRTEKLGRHLPYRYCFATTQAMIETLSGNFSAAIRHGERAVSMMPLGDTMLYPPTLRYLTIGNAQLGRYEQAKRHLDKLEAIKGELRPEDINVNTYPMPSEKAANLMRESLIAIGK